MKEIDYIGVDIWFKGGIFMSFLKRIKSLWHNLWSNRYRIVLENNQIIDVLIYKRRMYVNVNKI